MTRARVRRCWLSVATAAVAVLSGCTGAHAPDQSVILNDSPAAVADRADQLAIVHAYAERLRLGLGSPYRLVETVLRDARLGAQRQPLAHALLDSVRDGDFAEISPLALVDAGVDPSSAAAQLDLIQQTIEHARDPRLGEAAVVIAYQHLADGGLVSESVRARVTRIAALLRDRQLALADSRRLRGEAARLRIAPENLVLSWRRDRAFSVEQPTLIPIDSAERAEAEQLGLLLRGGVAAVLAPVHSELGRAVPPFTSGLLPEPAAHLLALDAAQDAVPQGALTITLRSIARGAAGTRARLASSNWQQFFARAVNEETFVAALAAAPQDSVDQRVAAGLAVEAATALRPFAQERIAISDSLSAATLFNRFGVRVRFGSSVTRPERAKLLTDLQYALEDLQRVLPGLRWNGLSFDVRPLAPDARFQAYHDPQHRVIRIDPAAAAGTLAHELGHDADWQLAARKYGAADRYATDYAVRRRKAMAYLVANLQPDERPAETFARRFEWYVAEALALQGRSNGFLSSVQNEWLTGYGSAVRPGSGLIATKSFVTILAEAADMDRAARDAAEQLVSQNNSPLADLLNAGAARQNPLNFPTTGIDGFAKLQP